MSSVLVDHDGDSIDLSARAEVVLQLLRSGGIVYRLSLDAFVLLFNWKNEVVRLASTMSLRS